MGRSPPFDLTNKESVGKVTESSVNMDFGLLLSVLLSMFNKKRLKPLLSWPETLLGAEGGIRPRLSMAVCGRPPSGC